MKSSLLFLILFSLPTMASIELNSGLQKLGEGKLTFLVFDIYFAELYGEKKEATLNQKLSLRLTYLRDFKAKDIIDRSMQEFKGLGVNQENMNQWQQYLIGMFPDVSKGTVLRAHYDPKVGVKIYFNEKKEYSNRNNLAFAKDFMGIWLSPKTSEPALRLKLFGVEDS